MDSNVGDTPDPFGPPPIVSAPVSPGRSRSRKIAIIAAIVAGSALVVGLLVVGTLRLIDRRESAFEEGREFTSSDGTFTMTLPAGWIDETDRYRSSFLERHGEESSIEGLAIADNLPFELSDNFVSMSGHPVTFSGADATTIGSGDLDDWRERFDDYDELPHETLTTVAGDEVWMGTLRGTTDGEEWEIVVATVVGEQSLARFDLELRPPYYDAADDFREALKTIVFAPAPAAAPIDDAFAPSADGRTYSSEGRASMVIPDDWEHLAFAADRDAFSAEIDFDYLGLWTVVDDGDTYPPSVSIVLDDRPDSSVTLMDEVRDRYPEIGGSETDEGGVVYTVEAITPWSADGADEAVYIDIRTDYSASGVGSSVNSIRERRCYALASGTSEMVACIDAAPDSLETAAPIVEDALQTVRFED